MGQQELSPRATKALAAVQELPQAELAQVVAIASTDLANRISAVAENSTSAKRAKASAEVVEGVKAALAHGFKQVEAPDEAIEVKITRPNGEEVTCRLSEGARDKRYEELAGYGKVKLQNATLLSLTDFDAVVESLYKAIKGKKVTNGALQTEDAALKQAYQIATEGVRTDGGFSRGVFDLDHGGAVAGRRFVDYDNRCSADGFRGFCALFGASPAESK